MDSRRKEAVVSGLFITVHVAMMPDAGGLTTPETVMCTLRRSGAPMLVDACSNGGA